MIAGKIGASQKKQPIKKPYQTWNITKKDRVQFFFERNAINARLFCPTIHF